MTDPDGPPRWAEPGVYALAIALFAGAAVLVATMPGGAISAFDAPWWFALVVGVGYFVSESFLFNIDVRREALSFSMSEVPTVFALAFLGPIPAIAIRTVFSLAAILRTSRPPLFKIVFNSALFAFELALAFTIVRSLIDPSRPEPGGFLVAAALGATAASLSGLIVIGMAIAMFEGGFLERVRSDFVSTCASAAIGALVGAIAVAPALFGLRFVWLPILPVFGVWFVMRSHGQLTQAHRDLADLHAFTGVIDHSLRLDDVAPRALDEISRLCGAGRVTLVLHRLDMELVEGGATGQWSRGTPIDLDDASIAPDRSEPVVLESAADAPGEPIEACTAFAVPIIDRGELLGTLALAAPSPRSPVFDAHAVGQAADMARQFSAAIRNGLLHARVEYAAQHDALTGEANRGAFEDRLREELGRPRAGWFAVLVLDLNQFKEVNDTLGHHVGDQVLVEFASRLSDLVGNDDLICRLGGDEFAVLVERPRRDEIRDLAERILKMSYQPLTLEACDAVVTTSIGIAFIGEHDVNLASILRRGDIAMYAAKNQRTGIEVYREEIDRRTPARLSLLGDLRTAIDLGELEVHYQPKVELATSTVVGAEALVRWHHPDRGWVGPDEFIGVAEDSGLIRMITEVVLTTSIRQAAAWRRAGYDFDIAVNLSTLDLHDEELAGRIAATLDAADLASDHLVLEITESALMQDTATTIATLDAIERLGVRLALDDFGTGYSSLSYLRRLPVAELKIDRSFVSDLLLNGNDDVIVRSTIDLGHNLGLKVVAEGIENAQVSDHLAELGCDIGQGFGIARPLDAEMFERWLHSAAYEARRVRRDAAHRVIPMRRDPAV